MESHRSSCPAAAPLGSRAPRCPKRVLTRRHLPPLRVDSCDSRVGDRHPSNPGKLVVEVISLVDAGLIGVSSAIVRHAPVVPNLVAIATASNVVVGAGATVDAIVQRDDF